MSAGNGVQGNGVQSVKNGSGNGVEETGKSFISNLFSCFRKKKHGLFVLIDLIIL